MTFRKGIASILRSVGSVLALLEHQLFQFTSPGSHELHSAVNTTTALPKAVKVFNIPTIPILPQSALHRRGGWIFPPIRNVLTGPLIGRNAD
jgi:hypothetical protein